MEIRKKTKNGTADITLWMFFSVFFAEIQESGTLQIVPIVLEFVRFFIQSSENYCLKGFVSFIHV
jgi:hypothetical protein